TSHTHRHSLPDALPIFSSSLTYGGFDTITSYDPRFIADKMSFSINRTSTSLAAAFFFATANAASDTSIAATAASGRFLASETAIDRQSTRLNSSHVKIS